MNCNNLHYNKNDYNLKKNKRKIYLSSKYKKALAGTTLFMTLTMSALSGATPAYAGTFNYKAGGLASSSVQSAQSEQSEQDALPITRLYGNTCYETAEKIATQGWSQSDYAILCYGEKFQDALASAPLAKYYDAPILLTATKSLTDQAVSTLKALSVKHVIIVGGTAVISPQVEKDIENLNLNIAVERLAGNTSYDTSIAVANRLSLSSTVFVATGDGYADALSVGAIAGHIKAPIILVPKDKIPDSVQTYFNRNNINRTYIIGGTAVISDAVAKQCPNPQRIAGNDCYDTNTLVLQEFDPLFDSNSLSLATGTGFADALTGAAYSIKNDMPIALIPKGFNASIYSYLSAKRPSLTQVYVYGGTGAVEEELIQGYLQLQILPSVTQADEATLRSRLYAALNFVETLSKDGVIAETPLDQLASRLTEIQECLADSSFKYSSSLGMAVHAADLFVFNLNLQNSSQQMVGNVPLAYDSLRTLLTSIKQQLGLTDTSTIVSNTIYAGEQSESGQYLSLTPFSEGTELHVLYGYHTYGVTSQDQYDALISAVAKAKQEAQQEIANGEDKLYNLVQENLNNSGISPKEEAYIKSSLGDSILSLPEAQLKNLLLAMKIRDIIINIYSKPSSGNSGLSAYTKVIYGSSNCLAQAYTDQLIYDSFGYNTRIIGTGNAANGDAYAEMQINGVWYRMDNLLTPAEQDISSPYMLMVAETIATNPSVLY